MTYLVKNDSENSDYFANINSINVFPFLDWNVRGGMNCATTNASPPKIDAYGSVSLPNLYNSAVR